MCQCDVGHLHVLDTGTQLQKEVLVLQRLRVRLIHKIVSNGQEFMSIPIPCFLASQTHPKPH